MLFVLCLHFNEKKSRIRLIDLTLIRMQTRIAVLTKTTSIHLRTYTLWNAFEKICHHRYRSQLGKS